MRKSFLPSLILVLLLALVLSLAGCVKPRPSPTPLPTKLSLLPTPVSTGAAQATATPAATATPEPTLEPTAAPTPSETLTPTVEPTVAGGGESTYEVRWGDTLSRIARQYGTTVEAIVARNPSITDPSRVVAGTVLVIPATGTTPPSGGTVTTPTTYMVQPGDTLSAIAQRFGTTVAALLAANPTLTNENRVYAGQTLVIPGATASGATRTHVVRPGDTVTSLARQYGTTVMAIVQRNNLPNANAIFVGQVLIIP